MVGGVVVKLLLALAAVLAAVQAILFAPVALGVLVEESTTNTLALSVAAGAVVSVLAAQVPPLASLKATLSDTGSFPDGHWPQSGVKAFTDASVKDGSARWSVKE